MLEEVHSGSRVDDRMGSWEGILETARQVAPARDHRVRCKAVGTEQEKTGWVKDVKLGRQSAESFGIGKVWLHHLLNV